MLYNSGMKHKLLSLILFLFLSAASCTPTNTSIPSTPSDIPPGDTPTPERTTTSEPSPTPTRTLFPTDTLTPTITFTPSKTPTITPSSTPVVLRDKVLQTSNCRYGPGAVFLYKYTVLPESNMEIIGRDQAGTWLLIRAIGGDNPCWIKASLMDPRGDVMNVSYVDPDIILPGRRITGLLQEYMQLAGVMM
jgi:hypothetical protein